jgi:hypothetical protein
MTYGISREEKCNGDIVLFSATKNRLQEKQLILSENAFSKLVINIFFTSKND